MTDEPKMRDTPMLDTDREAMRKEFGKEEFDNMTLAEFREATGRIVDDALDLYNLLSTPDDHITVERHDEEYTAIGHYNAGRFWTDARLIEWHHEAAGWADAVARSNGGSAIVRRPRDYDGCSCHRCCQGWTQAQGRVDDRELPGDRRVTA